MLDYRYRLHCQRLEFMSVHTIQILVMYIWSTMEKYHFLKTGYMSSLIKNLNLDDLKQLQTLG